MTIPAASISPSVITSQGAGVGVAGCTLGVGVAVGGTVGVGVAVGGTLGVTVGVTVGVAVGGTLGVGVGVGISTVGVGVAPSGVGVQVAPANTLFTVPGEPLMSLLPESVANATPAQVAQFVEIVP